MNNKHMNKKHWIVFALVGLMLFALTPAVQAHPGHTAGNAAEPATLVNAVRAATAGYKDLAAAQADGYGLFHGCVAGPQGGAMGVHYVNGDVVGDGELDAAHPEALLYEAKGGKMRLLGVEYVVIAEAWHANHDMPPVLMGQLFNYTGSPNRYGLPPFYALHVWAWQNNPSGMFADFNPQVSCEEFAGEDAPHASHS
ncbi:MAG: hypothetical protein U0X20_22790 [Caldilineaceae bacterium]